MPKKKVKAKKVDASMFFQDSRAGLASRPAERDEGDDGSSRFPDRDRRNDDAGGFSMSRGDEDQNWRGSRVQQPMSESERSRPSRNGDPDEDSAWRRGSRAQPMGRGDGQPDGPMRGRADMDEQWGRGTARQPELSVQNMHGRADMEERWGRGTARQPEFKAPRQPSRAETEERWGRGTERQPELQPPRFQSRADTDERWSRGAAVPEATSMSSGVGGGRFGSGDERGEWTRGQAVARSEADGERPAHLRLNLRKKVGSTEEGSGSDNDPRKKSPHKVSDWADDEEEDETEPDTANESGAESAIRKKHSASTGEGAAGNSSGRFSRGVERERPRGFGSGFSQGERRREPPAGNTRWSGLRGGAPQAPREPVKRMPPPESSRWKDLGGDRTGSAFPRRDRDRPDDNVADDGYSRGGGRFERRERQGFDSRGGMESRGRDSRFGDSGRAGGLSDQDGRYGNRSGGYEEDRNARFSSFGSRRNRHEDRDSSFGGSGSRFGGSDRMRGARDGYNDGGFESRGRESRFDGSSRDSFRGDRPRGVRMDAGNGDRYRGDDAASEGGISGNRPRLNLKRRGSGNRNAAPSPSRSVSGSSAGSTPSKANTESQTPRPVVKHHYIRTLEEFVMNPGSPTKAEAVDILLGKSIPKKFLSDLVVWAVSFACDRDFKAHRLVAELLVEMRRSKSNPVMQSNDMVLGFEMTVKRLPELQKDCPSAQSVLKLISCHCHEAGCWPKSEIEEMSGELKSMLGLSSAEADVAQTDASADAQGGLSDSEKQALANKLIGQNLRGEQLLAHYMENKSDYEGINEVDIYAAVLRKSAPLTADCPWATADSFGCLLETLLNEAPSVEIHLGVIAETARVLNELGFPADESKRFKYLSEGIFFALYDNDILPEEAFVFWSEDTDVEHEGKLKLLIQTTKWLTWLKTEDSDEEASDEDE